MLVQTVASDVPKTDKNPDKAPAFLPLTVKLLGRGVVWSVLVTVLLTPMSDAKRQGTRSRAQASTSSHNPSLHVHSRVFDYDFSRLIAYPSVAAVKGMEDDVIECAEKVLDITHFAFLIFVEDSYSL